MTENVFLHGTLCDSEIFEIVTGSSFEGRPASLPGYALAWESGQDYAPISPQDGATVDGFLVRLDAAAMDRLSYYCAVFQSESREERVECDGEPVIARVAVVHAPKSQPETAWSLDIWREQQGDAAREAAAEIMRMIGTHRPEQVTAILTQIRMRAASRVRARRHPTPDAMTPPMALADVKVSATRQPYTDYFAIREDDLRFPTFDGGLSASVTRATFLGGDAVTVLPYDPRLDCVLVIRQFRHGVFARGDAHPWLIEPAAGRIDPNEEPETTAHRELREETGVEGGDLHLVAHYYPSPSAYSEYIFSYVAVTDLSGRDGKTAGLDSEDEDIMSHVVSFERLMELVASGAANTAPLVLSAFWLAQNRKSLRASD